MTGKDSLDLRISPMLDKHWPQVERIYLEGIASGNATFETESPRWENWDAKHHRHSRLIALEGEDLLGWAALSPVSTRRVYAGVAEVSVYVGRSGAKPGCWASVVSCAGRAVGRERHLDPAGRNLSRESGQCRPAQGIRISRSRCSRADRSASGCMERCRAAGAPRARRPRDCRRDAGAT